MTPQTIGKYRVIKALGVGGFGAVYLAEDPKLKGKVAIKVFALNDKGESEGESEGESGKQLRDRFLSEATLLRQLSGNTHIVDIYDFDETEDGTPYFVMPYLDRSLVDEIGKDALTTESLNELPSTLRPRKLPMFRVIEILTEVLLGLSAVHSAELVHRDIKPANILFDVNGRAQLCDFGVAKIPDAQHSETGMAIGSRNYMSPEQRESGKHVTPRSDVYSVGVVAYRMLTGSLPIGPCDDPMEYCPEIGPDFNQLILASLSLNQEKRPADATDFLHRLREVTRKLGRDSECKSDRDSEDTVTEVGPAPRPVREGLETLEQSIESCLLKHAEIDEFHLRQFKMRASIDGVSDDALLHLIRLLEQRLASQIKPKQAFVVLVEEALSRANGMRGKSGKSGKLSPNTIDQLRLAGKTAGLSNEDIESAIKRRQKNHELENRKMFRRRAAVTLFCLFFGLLGWYFFFAGESASGLTENSIVQGAEPGLTGSGLTESARGQVSSKNGTNTMVVTPSTATPVTQPVINEVPKHVYTTMLSIPGGGFTMGSNEYSKVEQPVHRVSVESFQLGETEVTWEQFQRCIDAGSCQKNMSDQGWGKGNRPVINVSWDDVQSYIRWLNQETGQRFRLPSEAEWEYAARAGSSDNYSWGEDIGKNNANCVGCGSQWDDRKTAPVASFSANAYGLFDMHGNVWEWVQDCWHDNYQGAPSNGVAWVGGDGSDSCGRRVLRGGSWHNVKGYLRSAYRSADGVANRYFNFGFRLAHD